MSANCHVNTLALNFLFIPVINVGLGIALLENSCGVGTNNYTILWIYIAFVGFLLATQVSLFVIFTFIAFREKDSTGILYQTSIIAYLLFLAVYLQLEEDLLQVFSGIFCQVRQRKTNNLSQLKQ